MNVVALSLVELLPAGPEPGSVDRSHGWDISIHHGRCSSILAGPDRVPVPAMEAGSQSEAFTRYAVNFTRDSCSEAWKELASSTQWNSGTCTEAATYVCSKSTSPELIRTVVEFTGATTLSTALYIDDLPVAWQTDQNWTEVGIFSVVQAVDALLLLNKHCHKITIVHDDGMASSRNSSDSEHHRDEVSDSFYITTT